MRSFWTPAAAAGLAHACQLCLPAVACYCCSVMLLRAAAAVLHTQPPYSFHPACSGHVHVLDAATGQPKGPFPFRAFGKVRPSGC